MIESALFLLCWIELSDMKTNILGTWMCNLSLFLMIINLIHATYKLL